MITAAGYLTNFSIYCRRSRQELAVHQAKRDCCLESGLRALIQMLVLQALPCSDVHEPLTVQKQPRAKAMDYVGPSR